MIDQFTTQRFERAIPDASFIGMKDGEAVYHILLDERVSIIIRSSIGSDGIARNTGKDSIRLWLQDGSKPLGGKLQRYITRVAGWETRLTNEIQRLRELFARTGYCPKCRNPKAIYLSRTPRNPNRLFTKCDECSTPNKPYGFKWIDEIRLPDEQVEIDEASIPKNAKRQPIDVTDTPAPNEPISIDEMRQNIVKESSKDSASIASETTIDPLDMIGYDEATTTVVISKPFSVTPYHQSLFDFVESESGNGMMNARAGSGKSSTLVELAKRLPQNASAVYWVFGKRDAEDAVKKFQAAGLTNIVAMTQHKQGLVNAQANNPRIQVDSKGEKLRTILKASMPSEWVYEHGAIVMRLVSLCKNRVSEPTIDNLKFLCERYGIVTNGNESEIFKATEELFHNSIEGLPELVDFDDMLYLSAIGAIQSQRYDFILCDEWQDANPAQHAMLARSLNHGGRVIAVGDTHQAVMGFRGSDTESLEHFAGQFNPTQFTLPISYRCSRAVIRLAQTIVPDILARDDAPEGIVDEMREAKFYNAVSRGDMVICRTNAPLVKPCFDLIRRGIKATILGREIGQGLVGIIDKAIKQRRFSQFPLFLNALHDEVIREIGNLNAQNKTSQAMLRVDQLETIETIAEDCESVDGLKSKIQSIFSDQESAVTLSSIHKAKGAEAERVFILRPDLLPHPMATAAWETKQEANLKYVAITRAKSELYLVVE